MVTNIIILGFFNRDNLGDESYIITMKTLFGNDIRFLSIDSINLDKKEELLNGVSTIVCGGGDILSSYFMKRVQDFICGFKGNVYALSVGIPYQSEIYITTFIDMF